MLMGGDDSEDVDSDVCAHGIHVDSIISDILILQTWAFYLGSAEHQNENDGNMKTIYIGLQNSIEEYSRKYTYN